MPNEIAVKTSSIQIKKKQQKQLEESTKEEINERQHGKYHILNCEPFKTTTPSLFVRSRQLWKAGAPFLSLAR